jgi:hypothetical protein
VVTAYEVYKAGIHRENPTEWITGKTLSHSISVSTRRMHWAAEVVDSGCDRVVVYDTFSCLPFTDRIVLGR